MKAGTGTSFPSKGESLEKIAIHFENWGHFHVPGASDLLSVASLSPYLSDLWEWAATRCTGLFYFACLHSIVGVGHGPKNQQLKIQGGV